MAPSNITVRRVEQPSDELIEQAVQIFVDLMSDDGLALFLVGGNITLIPAMMRGMIRPLARISGEMYAATDENDKLVGFTLWSAPGRTLFDTEEQLNEGWNDFMGLVSDEAKGCIATAVSGEWNTFTNEALGIEKARTGTYWCHLAFVRADYHNKGIARALFELVFEKARKMGAVVALATTNEANVIKYEKLGMENKGHILMPSPWGDWDGWVFMRDLKQDNSQVTA